jgi:hypothetical protein
VGPRASLDGCGKLSPTGIRSPDRPARSESLYRLSYPGPRTFCVLGRELCPKIGRAACWRNFISSTSHGTQSVCIVKTSRLMLFRETVLIISIMINT